MTSAALRFWPRICHASEAIAVDITLRSVLGCSAADVDGAVLSAARREKETTYPELVTSARCRLVVVVIETGGRWSEEAVQFVWQLAQAKAQEAPRFLTQQAALAWERRWTRMLPRHWWRPMSQELLCETGGGPFQQLQTSFFTTFGSVFLCD